MSRILITVVQRNGKRPLVWKSADSGNEIAVSVVWSKRAHCICVGFILKYTSCFIKKKKKKWSWFSLFGSVGQEIDVIIWRNIASTNCAFLESLGDWFQRSWNINIPSQSPTFVPKIIHFFFLPIKSWGLKTTDSEKMRPLLFLVQRVCQQLQWKNTNSRQLNFFWHLFETKALWEQILSIKIAFRKKKYNSLKEISMYFAARRVKMMSWA